MSIGSYDPSIYSMGWPSADCKALARALTQDDDGSGDCGSATHLSIATLEAYALSYTQFLEFLARSGELSEAEGPGERATPQRVAAWRRENKRCGLAPTSRRQRLANLGAFLRLLVPDRDWKFIVRPGGRPLKRAIRGGPKPFVVRQVADVFVHVRQLHQQGLMATDGPAKWQALRDAALLALLLTRAPRVRSLVAMTMDRHAVLRSDDTWHIWFSSEDTKNGRALDYPLDAEVSTMLTDYVKHARSRFPRARTTDRLWLGMKGPMTKEGVQKIAERHTETWFGQAHSPHVFRKWLRASAARHSPELALDVADLEGHSVEVGVKAYAEASCLHSALRHGERLAERRARHASRAKEAFAADGFS